MTVLADGLIIEGLEPRPWQAHDVAGRYAEIFWLPVLGPSSLWLLRHAAMHTGGGHHPWRIHTDELSARLGITVTTLTHTIERLARFDQGDIDANGCTVRLATRLAWLGPRSLNRLPVALRDLHASYVAHHRSDLHALNSPKESA